MDGMASQYEGKVKSLCGVWDEGGGSEREVPEHRSRREQEPWGIRKDGGVT
jgi:hypothetical protein